ncbi:bromodomain-containing protein DDB_G0280777 [Drosophila novamexicana]|uniref:bromodomain-containing protein DDB_G0280777 n=1 Tax=Drosophila novamexicana TaxID=47314 RepID=UPI0011E5A63B|nr:bromodomain-containing protein DDB_G0280777 [Drosophila novamexicana]
MCQSHRLGANIYHFAVLIATILQVVHPEELQPPFQAQSQSQPMQSSPFAVQQLHRLPPAYLKGLLTLKGRLLANNVQLRPAHNPNSLNNPNNLNSLQWRSQQSNVEQNNLQLKPPLGPNSPQLSSQLSNVQHSFREAISDLNLGLDMQREEAAKERAEAKDRLHEQLNQLEADLQKQDNQLHQRELLLAAHVSSELPQQLEQMHEQLPYEQLEVQSPSSQSQIQPQPMGLQPTVQSPAQQELSVRDSPQTDGGSNNDAKMQLLQQLADVFGQEQQQQEQQQQEQLKQQQHQQQQHQQQLPQQQQQRVRLNATPTDPEEDDDDNDNDDNDEENTTVADEEEECDSTLPATTASTRKPTTKPPEHEEPVTMRVGADTTKSELKLTLVPRPEPTAQPTTSTAATQPTIAAMTQPSSTIATGGTTSKKLHCCTKPQSKMFKALKLLSLKKEQRQPQQRVHRRAKSGIKPDLRIEAIATLLQYRNSHSEVAHTEHKEPVRVKEPQVQQTRPGKKKRKQMKRRKMMSRQQRSIVSRKQLLQAEIWPIKIST